MLFLSSIDVINDISKMLTKNDLKITGLFINNPAEKFSIREISRRIRIDYKLVHNSIQRLHERKIIKKENFGKTKLYSIDLQESIADLVQVENNSAEAFLDKHTGIKLIVKEIKEKIKNPYYSLILFGSFAKGQQHQKSDLDLLIIVPERKFVKMAETVLNTLSRTKPVKIHSLVIIADDFKEMLAAKEELNVAKEVLNNHLIFHGAEAYYQLLKVL